MRAERIYQAMGYIDDRYLDMADPYREQPACSPGRSWKRRSLMALLAAAICISLLAVTAMAAGWIPGIFRTLQEQEPADKALFEAAAQANTYAAAEAAQIPQLERSQFVLREKYYDGETILLGYDLELLLPEPQILPQVDKQLLRKIKKGVAPSRVAWPSTTQQPWTAKPYTEHARTGTMTEDVFTMDWMMQGSLSEEAYQKAWEMVDSQGYVCLAARNVSIADHIFLNGHDHFEGVDPETQGWEGPREYETEYGACLRLENLPQEARNQPQVTVTLRIHTATCYWYMDAEGDAWIAFDDGETEEVSFELENTKGQNLQKEDAQ